MLLIVPKRKGHATATQGPTQKHQSLRRQREQGENSGKSLYCGFHGKEWVRQRKQVRIGSLKNVSALWGIRIVPSCLMPGPGMIKAEEYWF